MIIKHTKDGLANLIVIILYENVYIFRQISTKIQKINHTKISQSNPHKSFPITIQILTPNNLILSLNLIHLLKPNIFNSQSTINDKAGTLSHTSLSLDIF